MSFFVVYTPARLRNMAITNTLLLTMIVQCFTAWLLPTDAYAAKPESSQQAIAQQDRRNAEDYLGRIYKSDIAEIFAEYSRAVPVEASEEVILQALNSFFGDTNSLFSYKLLKILKINENERIGSTTIIPDEQRDIFYTTLGRFIGEHIHKNRVMSPGGYRNSMRPDLVAVNGGNSLPYEENQVTHALNFLSMVARSIEQRENTLREQLGKFHNKILLNQETILISTYFGTTTGALGALAAEAVTAIFMSPHEFAVTVSDGLPWVAACSTLVWLACYSDARLRASLDFPAYSHKKSSQALIQGLVSGLGVTDKKFQKQFVRALLNQNIQAIKAALCEGALTPKNSVNVQRFRVDIPNSKQINEPVEEVEVVGHLQERKGYTSSK